MTSPAALLKGTHQRKTTLRGLIMQIKPLLHAIVGLFVVARFAPSTVTDLRRERGLSQSAENAILLAGAVTVAGVVIVAITSYVKKHMPK